MKTQNERLDTEMTRDWLSEVLTAYRLPEPLGFGQSLAPVMYRAEYVNGSWQTGELLPYSTISIDPAATALQYAQQAFEGLKAYRVEQASPGLFRPEMNYFRLLRSSLRMCMPEISPEIFARSISSMTTALSEFIPSGRGQSLYLRPFLMGTGPCLAVKSSDAFTYLLIASPSDAYFSQPIRVMVEREHCRSAVGGTGSDKVGGNYAASLQATLKCVASGFSQPLWLDPAGRRNVEELSGMNLIAVIDGELHTPQLGGSILPGVTRDSLLELAQRMGYAVIERDIPIDELLKDITAGRCSEFFACGTAAIVCPISAIGEKDGSIVEMKGQSKVAEQLRAALLDIQEGRGKDSLGWMVDASDTEAMIARMQ